MNTNDAKMVVAIPKSGVYACIEQGEICLSLGWSDELEPTHRVMVSRTSSLIEAEEKMFVSKHKIPIQSLGGLLQKISEAVIDLELIVDFRNSEELGDYIYIEVCDCYRE